MPLGPGSRLDAYELLGELGAGGMGVVWLATDVPLGRRVALKVLPPELTRDPSRVARLHQEARAASALNHPNVCTILSLGEAPDGEHYIAMEYVGGTTLRQRLSTSPLKVTEALDIAVQVASALHAAHSAGIVHRDIKPENVIVRPDGLVKVLDFGLAKLTASDPGGLTRTAGFHTAPGVALGTVAYMSPEQARALEVDARTDIWSLGVLVYEMVTGRHPFAAPSSSETLAAILDQEPKPLSGIHPIAPAELHRVVSRALRKDPERRYQSMKDLQIDLQDLRRVLADPTASGSTGSTAASRATSDQATSSASDAWDAVPRKRWVPAAIAALVLLSATAGWWWSTRRGDRERGVATTPVAGQLTRLTFGNGAQIDPSLSPDGRFVAYASDAAGNFDIWMQPIGGGEPVQLTTDPAHDWEPAWSPDGRQLLFRSERDSGGLYLLSTSDRHLRKIAAFGHTPQWSPDGKHVLIGSGVKRASTLQLWISDLEGHARSFSEHLVGAQQDGAIGWLDSTAALVLYQEQHRVAAASINASSGRLRPLTVSPDVADGFVRLGLEIRPGERLAWGPDERALYFIGVTNTVADVWTVDVDRQASRITAGPRRVTTSQDVEGGLTSSVDGRRVAFSAGAPATQVWLYRLSQDGRQVMGPGEPVTPTDMEAVDPALSPDGRRLAVIARRIGGQPVSELIEKDLVTGPIRTLRRIDASRDEDIFSVRWAPDGHRLSYRFAERRGGRLYAWVRVLETQPEVVESDLTTPFFATGKWKWPFENPWSWSRDGRFIVASSSRYIPGKAAVALLPTEAAPHAERAARVLDDDALLAHASISPNGRWVCYMQGTQGVADSSVLGVLPANGGARRVLTSGAWDDKPRWSADGRFLYFVSNRGGTLNLWGLEFDAERGVAVGAPFRLTSFSYVLLPMAVDAPEISVAGRLVVAPLARTASSIWMVE